MDPQTLMAIAALIREVSSGMKALDAVADEAEHSAQTGQTFTFERLKELSLSDDAARETLARAIEQAEE